MSTTNPDSPRRSRRPTTAVARTALLAALCAGAIAVIALAAAAPSMAADARPPRIVAAVMRDADGDGRADRVRLTYSERVRHAADRDGRYPFRVAGYRIRAVGAAGGRAIVIALAERADPDGAARPAVRYTRARAGRVVDRARNQAARQLFRSTRAHANGAAPSGTPGDDRPPTGRPTANDRDGDGTADAADCAADDPAIAPGARDLPDLRFVDANCDGIDGTASDAIFVSSAGNDANPGTRTAPKREIQAAVLAAALTGKDVYVAAGDYSRVETVSGADVYGGYVAPTWRRDVEARTRIVGRPEAVLATGDTVTLQLLTVVGLSGGPGSSAYGIRAVAGANLALQRVEHIASRGADATDSANGANGVRGGDGGRGENGACDTEVGGNAGTPGASPAGFRGGYGGRGGLERLDRDGTGGQAGSSGVPGGAGGANGDPGRPGRHGTDGAPGASGAHGRGGTSSPSAPAPSAWQGVAGTDGAFGAPGLGGGGGGGGQKGRFVIDGVGNGGGGGGGGGSAGTGGRGGAAGGGSFGLYLHDATATVTAGGTIQTGDGGTGGDGGRGGLPGPGGGGGKGGTYCTAEVGTGGDGGDGGTGGFGGGGGGGGGAGGPSIGVVKGGRATVTLRDVSIRVGAPGAAGAPGAGGTGGTPAEPGVVRAVYPS